MDAAHSKFDIGGFRGRGTATTRSAVAPSRSYPASPALR